MEATDEKKSLTVRISKKDLLKLLAENERLQQQVKDLQGRCNEYLEEVRSLKKDLEEAENTILEQEDVPKETQAERIKKVMEEVARNRPEPMPYHPFGPDIYLDGASKFNR